MKQISRIFKIVFLLFISLLLVLSLAAFLLQDRIINIITESLNKQLLTKFEYGKSNLSFISNWPKATVKFNNLLVHSSTEFNSKEFTEINADTLLFATSAQIEFSITDIIARKYKIDRITVSEGILRLLSDSAGRVNYEITKDDGESGDGDFDINLNSIVADDITTHYINLASGFMLAGQVEKSSLRSRIRSQQTDLRAEGNIAFDSVKIDDFRLLNKINAGFNVDLEASDSLLTVQNGSLRTDSYRFGVSGTYNFSGFINLLLNGENLSVSEISSLLNEKYKIEKYGFIPSGKFDAVCTITGPLTKTKSPDLSLSFSMSDGSVAREGKSTGISSLSFKGIFGNKSITDTSRSGIVGISDLSFLLGDSQYKGSLSAMINDSITYVLSLNGPVVASDVRDFFNLSFLESVTGEVQTDLKLKGTIDPEEKITPSILLAQQSASTFDFTNFSLSDNNSNFRMSDVNGAVAITDIIAFTSLSALYKDNSFTVNGYITGLQTWYAGNNGSLGGKLDLAFDKLMPEKLLASQNNEESLPGKSVSVKQLPDDIMLDVSIRADDFEYNGFTGKNLVAETIYSSPRLTVNNLTINALDGIISGKGFIHQNKSLSLVFKGDLELDNININKSFITFRNFGQEFIKAENLEGSVSGNVSFLVPVDTNLNIDSREISAEGRYIISNGTLQNFMPLEELSSFIEITELRNIKFETLENDFFIRNNYLYTPQMDIRSSAAELSLNGKHSFDNVYEYHIRVRLSDVLSKKIGKPKPNTTEFGAVADDGLGRTSISLKITGNDEDFKVGYDAKAAGEKIKNDIRNERENLKSILKEEYGMFKNDTTVPTTKTEKSTTPRFRIEGWGNDTVPEVKLPAETKKVSPVKSLFKKKI